MCNETGHLKQEVNEQQDEVSKGEPPQCSVPYPSSVHGGLNNVCFVVMVNCSHVLVDCESYGTFKHQGGSKMVQS